MLEPSNLRPVVGVAERHQPEFGKQRGANLQHRPDLWLGLSSDAPFGASVSIFGQIPGAPLFTFPLVNLPKYQITFQEIDTSTNTLLGSPQIVTDPFGLICTQQIVEDR